MRLSFSKKKLALTGAMVLFSVRISAQYGFSSVYEMNAPGAGFHNILIEQDTLYVAGTAQSETTQQWGFLLSKFDTMGNLLSQKTIFDSLGDDYIFEPNYAIIKTSDNNIAVTGNLWLKNWGFMAKMTKNGDLIFLKEFPEAGILNFQYKSIVELPEGYLMAGTKQLPNYRTQVFLQRLNAQGELLWEKKYGNPNNYNFFGTIKKLEHNAFIIGATEQSYPWQQPYIIGQDWIKSRLFEIDSSGNMLWEHKSENYAESSINGLQRTPDGSLLYLTSEIELFNQWSWGARTLLIKRDSNLNLLWSRYLSPTAVIGNTTLDLKFTPEGDLLVLAKWASPDGSTYGWPGSCLYKLSINGDSIWSRCDTVPGALFYSDDLGGLDILPSGSVLAAGKVNRSASNEARSLGWLLKVDKNGCLDPLCHLSNALTEPELSDDGFSVYPNPAENFLAISIHDEPSFTASLFDAQGRRIFQRTVESKLLTLDLSEQQRGVYFLLLASNGKRILRKVVKI